MELQLEKAAVEVENTDGHSEIERLEMELLDAEQRNESLVAELREV